MEELGLSSRSYFLWNNSLGFGVLGRGMDVQTEVASLTKIMTALLVLETRDLAETVVITPEMLSGLYEFAVIGLTVGQVKSRLHRTRQKLKTELEREGVAV